MRISDWSSDVCSSDLLAIQAQHRLIMLDDDAVLLIERRVGQTLPGFEPPHQLPQKPGPAISAPPDHNAEIGRASCRERVCQYVSISVVAVALKKKNN